MFGLCAKAQSSIYLAVWLDFWILFLLKNTQFSIDFGVDRRYIFVTHKNHLRRNLSPNFQCFILIYSRRSVWLFIATTPASRCGRSNWIVDLCVCIVFLDKCKKYNFRPYGYHTRTHRAHAVGEGNLREAFLCTFARNYNDDQYYDEWDFVCTIWDEIEFRARCWAGADCSHASQIIDVCKMCIYSILNVLWNLWWNWSNTQYIYIQYTFVCYVLESYIYSLLKS